MRYESKKTKAKQTSEFSRDKRLRNHFYHIQLKIETIILGCKSGASGLISKSSSSLSHAVNPSAGINYKHYLKKGIDVLFQDLKKLPVVGGITEVLSKCIELISEMRKHNEFETFANTIPLRTCLIAAQELAFALTKSYESQLLMIKKTKYEKVRQTRFGKLKGHMAKGADKLKETVLNKKPKSYVNHLAEYGALIVLNSIFNLHKPKEDTNPHAWARFWMKKIKLGYNQEEDPILTLFYKIFQDPAIIYTESEMEWDIRHIYCKTGINVHGEIYGHSAEDIDLYGTRVGTEDEAETLNMRHLGHSKPEMKGSSLSKSKSSPQIQSYSPSQFENISTNSENAVRKADVLERRLKTLEIKMNQFTHHQRVTPEQLHDKLKRICRGQLSALQINQEGNVIKFSLVKPPRHRHDLLKKIATELSYLNETSDCEISQGKQTIKWVIRTTHLAQEFFRYLKQHIEVKNENNLDDKNTHRSSRSHRRGK